MTNSVLTQVSRVGQICGNLIQHLGISIAGGMLGWLGLITLLKVGP